MPYIFADSLCTDKVQLIKTVNETDCPRTLIFDCFSTKLEGNNPFAAQDKLLTITGSRFVKWHWMGFRLTGIDGRAAKIAGQDHTVRRCSLIFLKDLYKIYSGLGLRLMSNN